MTRASVSSWDLRRLQVVQRRVRSLALDNEMLRKAMRAAFDAFLELTTHHTNETAAAHRRKLQVTRDLLSQGRLFDPSLQSDTPCMFVGVTGLCPIALAERTGQRRRGSDMPEDLERENAAAALAALDRNNLYYSSRMAEDEFARMSVEDRAAVESKTHVEFKWQVTIRRPDDWLEPASPHSLDVVPIVPEPPSTGAVAHDMAAYVAKRFASGSDQTVRAASQLARFSDRDYRTIALYRLGGLADAQNVNPSEFPPDVAEQMLSVIESWVRREKRSDDNNSAKLDSLHAAAEAIDENDMAILKFLDKNRLMRRKVSDVIPNTGPGDRKAIAKRLRKLAERQPPLVDYPKGKHGQVSITPAGTAFLLRATAMTSQKGPVPTPKKSHD